MDVVKKNFFDTPNGRYQISILIDEHEDLYFVKWKNDILVEMVNLSDKRKTHEKLSRYESFEKEVILWPGSVNPQN